MSSKILTNEDKKRLTNERQQAVRLAWKNEVQHVINKHGTRNWTVSEQQQLVKRKSISGYQGHHMKSVSEYPNEANNPKNIQFLNSNEHLCAHKGSYLNITNGYYDPISNKMNEFVGDEISIVPILKLSVPYDLEEESSLEKLNSQAYDKKIDKVRNNYIKQQTSTEKPNNQSNEQEIDKVRNNYIKQQTSTEKNITYSSEIQKLDNTDDKNQKTKTFTLIYEKSRSL